MRRLHRPSLAAHLVAYLSNAQTSIDEGADVEITWKRERRKAALREIFRILGTITGRHERCMFCEDSRGTDIEHFWPRSPYRQFAFLWENFLLSCSGCNRCKSNRFPLGENGKPILIDPTVDDPWDYFFYDTETDELTARWEAGGNVENERARQTLEVLSTLRHQAVLEGRGRVRRNLKRSVLSFLQRSLHGDNQAELHGEFLESIQDNDGFGLLHWFFLREGQEEFPFSKLREDHPDVWNEITLLLSG